MSDNATGVSGALLVGSVGLQDAEQVFTETSRILGRHVKRLPDGETGPREQWIGFQRLTLQDCPQLEETGADLPGHQLALKAGADPGAIDLGDFGYGDEAIASYAIFKRLQAQGAIPQDMRFQVCLPTPFAGNHQFVRWEDREALMPAFERAIELAVKRIADAIPASELAFQWDFCLEIGLWERPYARFDERDPISPEAQARASDKTAALGDLVPAQSELGYHLCYGSWGHKHFVEPKDTAILVEIANGLAQRTGRAVNWIHLPVPIERDDDAYFEPLEDLKLGDETELYLGLVHYRDGAEGTRRRIEAALRHVDSFGVATECGMASNPARRPEDQDLLKLMAIHSEVAEPVRATV